MSRFWRPHRRWHRRAFGTARTRQVRTLRRGRLGPRPGDGHKVLVAPPTFAVPARTLRPGRQLTARPGARPWWGSRHSTLAVRPLAGTQPTPTKRCGPLFWYERSEMHRRAPTMRRQNGRTFRRALESGAICCTTCSLDVGALHRQAGLCQMGSAVIRLLTALEASRN